MNELEKEKAVSENTVQENAVSENTAQESTGSENTVQENTGSENAVQENTGSEKAVPEQPDFLEETAPKPKAKQGKWRSFCEFCSKWLTGLVFLTILAQFCYLLMNKEPYCPNEGCKIVDAVSPLPPLVMNGTGLAYFGLLFLLFWSARKRPEGGAARALLPPFLLAGMAAEGVLTLFQYLNGVFCLYCCVILGALFLINLCWGGRQMLAALFVFGGVCVASFFLTQPKTLSMPRMPKSGIESGTFALKAGPAGSETRYFFFSESCRHCKGVLTALLQDGSATLRLNPLAAPQTLELSGTEQQKDFTPEANTAFLRGLGIGSVPVLLVQREDGSMLLHEGVSQISAYLGGVAGTVPEAGPAPETEKAKTGDTPAASKKDAAGSDAVPEDAGAKPVQEEMQPEQSGESLTQPDKSAAGETAQAEQATPEPAAAEAPTTEASAQAAGTQEAPKADAPAKGAIPALRPSPDTKAPGAGPQEAPNNSQNQTELKKVSPSAPLSPADAALGQSRSEAGVNLSSNQKDRCSVDTRNCN